MNYNKHIRPILCFAMLLTCYCLVAQPGSNPFDLKDRNLEVVNEEIPPTTVTQEKVDTIAEIDQKATTPVELIEESGNPFDVQRPKPGSQARAKKKIIKKAIPDAILPSGKRTNQELSGNFLFWMITTLLILLTLTVTLYGSYISKVYRAFINENFLKMIHREHGTVVAIPYFFLYTLFFISGGVFLFLVFRYFQIQLFDSNFYGLISYIATVAGVFILKHILLNIIAFVFPIAKEVKQYSFTIIIFGIILGLILVPANVLIAFAPAGLTKALIYGTFVAIVLIYLFRILRSIFIASRFITVYKFHFFMYLCTLEIAPLLILIKMVLLKSTEI